MQKTIAVIYGGKSAEHEVSVISGKSIAKNLDRKKFKIREILIDKRGSWFINGKTKATNRAYNIVRKEDTCWRNKIFFSKRTSIDMRNAANKPKTYQGTIPYPPKKSLNPFCCLAGLSLSFPRDERTRSLIDCGIYRYAEPTDGQLRSGYKRE